MKSKNTSAAPGWSPGTEDALHELVRHRRGVTVRFLEDVSNCALLRDVAEKFATDVGGAEGVLQKLHEGTDGRGLFLDVQPAKRDVDEHDAANQGGVVHGRLKTRDAAHRVTHDERGLAHHLGGERAELPGPVLKVVDGVLLELAAEGGGSGARVRQTTRSGRCSVRIRIGACTHRGLGLSL